MGLVADDAARLADDRRGHRGVCRAAEGAVKDAVARREAHGRHHRVAAALADIAHARARHARVEEVLRAIGRDHQPYSQRGHRQRRLDALLSAELGEAALTALNEARAKPLSPLPGAGVQLRIGPASGRHHVCEGIRIVVVRHRYQLSTAVSIIAR